MSSPVSKVNQFGFPHGPLGHLVGLVMRHGNADMEQAAIDALELHGSEHVLEIGSGPGVGLRLLADRLPGGRVTGLDPSPVMVAQLAVRRHPAPARAAGRAVRRSAYGTARSGQFVRRPATVRLTSRCTAASDGLAAAALSACRQ